MKCPFCATPATDVLESRSVEDGDAIRRRRKCTKCSKRFTTFERVRGNALWVIKKDGRREPYESDKVKRGILRAVEKRPISMKLVDDIVESVQRVRLKKENEEVISKAIGREVLNRLKRVDKVAWLRFASVYLEFEDLEDFARAIK